MPLPAPALEPAFELTVFVATPIEAGAVTGLNSRGRRRIIPITGGTVRGQIIGTGARFPDRVEMRFFRVA